MSESPKRLGRQTGMQLRRVESGSYFLANSLTVGDGICCEVRFDQNTSALGRFSGSLVELGLFKYAYDLDTGFSNKVGTFGGFNTYAYVSGDPISKVDPSGLKGVLDSIADRAAGVPAGRDGDQYRNPIKNPTCMEACLAKYGGFAAVKTAGAQGLAEIAASRGMVATAMSWTMIQGLFPYSIPLAGAGVMLDCDKKCNPKSCPDEPETTFHGAP